MRCASYSLAVDELAPRLGRRVPAARCGGIIDAHPERRQPRDRHKHKPYLVVPLPSQAASTPRASDKSSMIDLGAQFVEVEFFDERRAERPRNVEKKAAAVRRRRFGHDEIRNDLALRRQQRTETRRAGCEHRAMSAVTSPWRKFRAPSPATLTTPRSGRRAAFMSEPSYGMPKPRRRIASRSGLQSRARLELSCCLAEKFSTWPSAGCNGRQSGSAGSRQRACRQILNTA